MKTVGAKARVVGDNSSDAVQAVPLDLADALYFNVKYQEYQGLGARCLYVQYESDTLM